MGVFHGEVDLIKCPASNCPLTNCLTAANLGEGRGYCGIHTGVSISHVKGIGCCSVAPFENPVLTCLSFVLL